MSFLNKFVQKHKAKGKIVYDLSARELGKISDLIQEGDNRKFEIEAKENEFKLLFPEEQIFKDETGTVYLLPKWAYEARVASSKLTQLKRRYVELQKFLYAISSEKYTQELANIIKEAIPYGERIIHHFPKFEQYLKKLKNKKEVIINETTRLMTLRLLEYKSKRKEKAATLTKKEYSLKVINLRTKYAIILKAIQILSKLYEDARLSLAFLDEVLQQLDKLTERIAPITFNLSELFEEEKKP